ncbi:unnamed protein product [Oreochromis niloticus]|nr:unnamed protein product [Mustela putorius furo]
MVNDVQLMHYDSSTSRAVPKQDWMNRITDAQYWDTETEGFNNTQQLFREDIKIAQWRFIQTGGVHIVQLFYGCEWDDEVENITGYHRYGYDGEDFIVFDLKTETWVAPKEQAFITKLNWDRDADGNTEIKNYITQECVDWLKKYVNYGRCTLMRTDRPSVSLLQKTSSSPITCHATGFYPNTAKLVWRKDGEEIHEGVNKGEILPNNDGTFQMSADLDLSAIAYDDWKSSLKKTSSSLITCHATGFYPNTAKLVWRKDGEEIHEGVNKGEILPNNDGTFQMSADLDLSAIAYDDWKRYDCVFQLSGVTEDIVTELDKTVIKTNKVPVGKTGMREDEDRNTFTLL